MNLKLVLLIAVFIASATPAIGQAVKAASDLNLEFKALFIRPMTRVERDRLSGDNLDPDLLMRWSLTNNGNEAVWYYVDFPRDSVEPRGNLAVQTHKGLMWVKDSGMQLLPESPGLRPLSSGGWLKLKSGASVEWTALEIAEQKPQDHAATIFVKLGEKGEAVEVLSHFYRVPVKQP